MSRTPRSEARHGRPVRALVLTLVLTVALGGLAFGVGARKLNLGLDLRGGTSVTLQPRVQTGETGQVTSDSINQAVAIIRQRVDSLGVAESEVTSQGTGSNRQIVISVPGETGRRIVDLVGQTAELRFRQVLLEAGATPSAQDDSLLTNASLTDAEKSKFKALDCSKPESLQGSGGDDANAGLVTCSRDGGARFILAPAKVIGRDVKTASAAIDQQGASGWYVSLK